jgi:pimeloyl-ACP methyl ester carboxylesterase
MVQLPTEATEAISVIWNPRQPLWLPLPEKIVKSAPLPQVEDPPISECEARVGGYRLRYLRSGSGPPLVLIHGLMGYSFSWRFNIPALAQHFTVYAPDMPGIGFSDRPPGLDCRLQACTERMLEWLDQLGLPSLNLLGTSHGGGIACAMTAMALERGHPRVERLILVASINPWSHHGRKRIALLSNPLGAFAFRQTFPYIRRVHSYFLRRMYGDPARVTQATLNGYAAALAQPRTAEYGLGVVRSWHAGLDELRALYPRLRGIPIQLIWGDRDLAVSPQSAYEVQRALPGSELVMLPGIGHMPYEETPEQFNRILLEFLGRA